MIVTDKKFTIFGFVIYLKRITSIVRKRILILINRILHCIALSKSVHLLILIIDNFS